MSYGLKLHVWGEYACFTRPEMKVERLSYDVMTPSAARGIVEAIYWKPQIRWTIDRIHVLKPIRLETFRRNEIGSKLSEGTVRKAMKSGKPSDARVYIEDNRQQRAATILRDVGYGIEARFEIVQGSGDEGQEAKHLSASRRRAQKGQCFHRPYLGNREFPAHFELVEGGFPDSELEPGDRDRDLGWMLYDIDFQNGMNPTFFQARMVDGTVEIPSPGSAEIRR